MSRKDNNAKGFTIIEVVLVLAIAGLIFLVVFLALPALQRSQRDTQRKNDLSRMMSQVTQYQSNTQGSLPDNWNTTFKSNYLTSGGQSFRDPQADDYTITVHANQSDRPSDPGQIYIFINAKCAGDGLDAGAGNRSFAAMIYQEQGGHYCQNN